MIGKNRVRKQSDDDLYFEYSLGKLFEEPISSNLIKLKSDLKETEFLFNLMVLLTEYVDVEEE